MSLFKRKANRNRSGRADTPSAEVAIVARSMMLQGEIGSRQSQVCKLHVEGLIDGNVDVHEIIIGVDGRVEGDIKAKRVVIQGTFKGNIDASYVLLEDGATVDGRVKYDEIVIRRANVTAELVKRQANNVTEINPSSEKTEPAEEVTPYNMYKAAV